MVELDDESRIRGVVRLDEFDAEPAVGDKIAELFVLGADRKNFYVPLSLSQPFDAAMKNEQNAVKPDTLGDLFGKNNDK